MPKNKYALELFRDCQISDDMFQINSEEAEIIEATLKQNSVLVEALREIKQSIGKYQSQTNGSISALKPIDDTLKLREEK